VPQSGNAFHRTHRARKNNKMHCPIRELFDTRNSSGAESQLSNFNQHFSERNGYATDGYQ